MLLSEEIILLKQYQQRQEQILVRKANDYASKDSLSNFKIQAEILKLLGVDITTPEGTCISLIVLKLIRYCNLRFTGKVVYNESHQDTLIDMGDYVFLLHCIEEEAKKLLNS